MRFEIEQVIAGPVESVARLYTERRFYERLGELPKLGHPEVLDREEDGSEVRLAVRFRFTGELSPAVTKVVDPARLSWVEESVHDLSRHTVDFTMKPDNYADRLRFVPDAIGKCCTDVSPYSNKRSHCCGLLTLERKNYHSTWPPG